VKRSILATAALVAITAGSVGLSAPAALAKPGHQHGSTTHQHGPATHGSHRLSNAQRQVQREVARKDSQLSRVLDFHGYTVLGADDAAAVSANVAADQAALAALGDQVAATTSVDEVRAMARQVHAVRPPAYHLNINDLRRAARVQSTLADVTTLLADLSAAADALEAQGVDVTLLRAAIDAATQVLQDVSTAATTATDLARALTAVSTHADQHAALSATAAAAQALAASDAGVQAAQDALAALATPVAP
jgi:hypothetical protein